MAQRCLGMYTGARLVYVGEGRGGVNAAAAFFDALERDWEVQRGSADCSPIDCRLLSARPPHPLRACLHTMRRPR
jgi:hypothetical protein